MVSLLKMRQLRRGVRAQLDCHKLDYRELRLMYLHALPAAKALLAREIINYNSN